MVRPKYINSYTQILRPNQMVKTGGKKNIKIQTYRKRNYWYLFLAAPTALAAGAALAALAALAAGARALPWRPSRPWRPVLPLRPCVPFLTFVPFVPFIPFSPDNVNRHCDEGD